MGDSTSRWCPSRCIWNTSESRRCRTWRCSLLWRPAGDGLCCSSTGVLLSHGRPGLELPYAATPGFHQVATARAKARIFLG